MQAEWFATPGPQNTQATIEVVKARLKEGDITRVAIATTSGATAVAFAEALAESGVALVCVTHHVGFTGGDASQLEPEHRDALRRLGAEIVTATHALSGVGRSISKTLGGVSGPEVVAHTLRLLGQGMKVCVEIAVMAADAGRIPTDQDVICVGGTGRGADTAVVLRPAHMNAFFDLKIRETLCRPIGA
ncbi:MAG: hypothetical protein WBC63_06345 [Candidatus Bipolaricaulia bacterium]